MIRKIIKELAGYYNKGVRFDLNSNELEADIKDFKVEDNVIGKNRYIVIAKVKEFEDYIKVIGFRITTVSNKKYLELNPGVN